MNKIINNLSGQLNPGWDKNWQIIHTIIVLTLWKHSIATPNILEFRDIYIYFVYCHECADQIVHNTVVKLGLYPHMHTIFETGQRYVRASINMNYKWN